MPKAPTLEKVASPFAMMLLWNYADDYRRAGFSASDVARALVAAARPATKPKELQAFMIDMLEEMHTQALMASMPPSGK